VCVVSVVTVLSCVLCVVLCGVVWCCVCYVLCVDGALCGVCVWCVRVCVVCVCVFVCGVCVVCVWCARLYVSRWVKTPDNIFLVSVGMAGRGVWCGRCVFAVVWSWSGVVVWRGDVWPILAAVAAVVTQW
jgi:hypothetical protein